MPASPEVNERELRELLLGSGEGRLPHGGAVFLYTPLCGTCAVASRMLDVVRAMVPELPLVYANVNAMPELAREWRIESVPCVLIWSGGHIVRREYAMKSVEHLLAVLAPLRQETPAGPEATHHLEE